MTQAEVYDICKVYASRFTFDPILILAMCEQESSYNPGAWRFERNYFYKYVQPHSLATSAGLLLSFSYGLMQVMGDSLYQMGYFDQGQGENSGGMASAVDQFILSPDLQVEYGCRWLDYKKGDRDIKQALIRYNGSPEYLNVVLPRYERLKATLSQQL